MSSNPLRLKYLLGKYLQNTINKEELEEFWLLMSKLSDNDLVDMEIANLWNDPSLDKDRDVNWETVYDRLQQRMDDQDIDYAKVITMRSKKWKQFAVAALVIGLLIFSSFFLFRPSTKEKSIAISSQSSYDLQVIRLPDGTVVTLNHNSKLDYPGVFNNATREVYLYGEAFFDVKHDASKPFIVHTGNFITRVLGTAFNIKDYEGDKDMSVTVSKGKVQVQKNNTEKILGLLVAGDQLILNKKMGSILQQKVNVNEIINWKTKDMAFDNKTVDEASVIISNYFGIEIKFTDKKLRRCRFTANFRGGEDDLKQVMDVITELTNSTWKKDSKDIIWLDGKGCD